MAVFALIETEELPCQRVLCFEGNSDDRWWLSLTTAIENESRSSVMPVVQCGFNEKTTDMGLAGFGNRSPVFSVAGRVFIGYQSEIFHELARRRETSDVVYLTEQSEGSKSFDTTQTSESFDRDSVGW
jgi:hypothetical protein